jgi:hypothetical protein
VAVSTLLDVLVVQVDLVDPVGSLALVKWQDPALEEAAMAQDRRILRIGDELLPPHNAITVAAISVDGVEFSFPDGERESELVAPVGFPTGGPSIVKVGEGGAILPIEDPQIRDTGKQYYSPESYEFKKGEWRLGPESLQEMNEDYSRILSQDVQYRAHRDPRTGQVDGLEVTKVKEGSIVAKHGVEEGEVLKSINGHKVTGVNDAIAFVKKEADHTDTWIAIFEKRGREIRRVYHSPPPE